MFVFSILSLIAAGGTKGPEIIFSSLIIVLLAIDIAALLVLAFKNDIDKKIIAFIIKVCNWWIYIYFFFILVCGFTEDSIKITYGNAIRILILILFESTGFICLIFYIFIFIFMCCDKISDDAYFEFIFDLAVNLCRGNES